MTVLASILDYEHEESSDIIKTNEIEKEKDASDNERWAMSQYKDKLKENYKLNREIMSLKQQLIEKERRIKKMEFIFENKS